LFEFLFIRATIRVKFNKNIICAIMVASTFGLIFRRSFGILCMLLFRVFLLVLILLLDVDILLCILAHFHGFVLLFLQSKQKVTDISQ